MCVFFHLFGDTANLVLEILNIDIYVAEYLIYWIPPWKIYSPEGLGFLSVRYLDNSRCKHYPESLGKTQLSPRVLQNMLQAYKAGTASGYDVLSKALETGKYVECSWVTGNSWLNLPCWNSSLWLRGAQAFWTLPSLQSQAALLWAVQGVVWNPSRLSHTLLFILQENQGFVVCRQDSIDSGKGWKPIWGSTGGRKGKVGLSWQIPSANPSWDMQTALGRGDGAPQSHAFFFPPIGSFPKALKHSAVKLFPQ